MYSKNPCFIMKCYQRRKAAWKIKMKPEIWCDQSHVSAILIRPSPGWDLEASSGGGGWGRGFLLTSALATGLDWSASLLGPCPEHTHIRVTRGLLQGTVQSPPFVSSCLLLGDPGRSNHPGQSPAGGLWKCQDREEWQLLKICKTQSNLPPPTPPPHNQTLFSNAGYFKNAT